MEPLGTTDGRIDAVGTADQGVRFAWTPTGPQTAVRVVVRDGDAVVWDSGPVATSEPWLRSPSGVRFAPWRRHDWEARIDSGASVTTARGAFTPAPTDERAWHDADWVAATDGAPETDHARERSRDGSLAAPVLARTIAAGAPVTRALLAVTAGGHVDVRVDGRLATDEVLSPTTTHWDQRVQVVLHDLTPAFADGGGHDLGLELGRGFFGMTNANVWAWERAPWHAEPRVRALLRLEREDGAVEVIGTGPDWTARRGTILLDDLYGGEIHDLRRRPGRPSAGAVRPAVVVPGPGGRLEARLEQPIRVVEELVPDSVVETAPGEWVVAFPRVIAGWVRLRLPGGAAGSTVRIRYGERLRADGLPNADDEKHYFADGFQTDEVTLDDDAVTWEPRFSYKGFRYVQVSGWPSDAGPAPSDFVACVVRTDAAVTSTFTVDDDLLQWIHDATVRTMENNLHGYPTDTPKYEKNGWTGDAAVGADMFLTDLDAAAVLTKWVGDLAETTTPGHPPALIAPNAGVFGVDERAPVWHAALATVPWDLYRHTGDPAVLGAHVETIEEYARFELSRSPGGIADTILGDWVAPGTDPGGGNPPEDSRVPATAFLVRILDTVARIDDVLGRDGSWAATAADDVRRAFVDAFVVDGVVRGPRDEGFRQSHQVLALAFDVVRSPADRASIAAALAADVRARGDHLDTGAIGTKWLLPVLTDAGYADVALAVARQTTVPSWGAWWAAGATSTFEHWDLAARSHGHYFLGTVDDWLTGYVAGLRPVSPGWRRFLVAPAVCGAVGAASCSVRTPYGTAGVRWSAAGGVVTLTVDVPPGTTAEVRLPDGSSTEFGPGSHTVSSALA
ncbi:alpha-L-rhamnosidase [Curtobacterium sp. ZW137]|uniref:alpha-L-rhamnosidase n=1 Tax=Curtobacterium sp. ZW137 TaxID=2485104 RepID=UPI000F4C6F75|nr:alpha-L-rhamnosidase [Curtobacterium sp. ZW137]ROP60919.1 alpha-L-rhamnosidase [Curtobacterium sp. ZW137]